MSRNKKYTHQCVICNAPYTACNLCEQELKFTPWRALCDTSKHYQIYQIIAELRGKVMNESEAKDSLIHIGVTTDEIKTFIPAVQDILLPIMETKVEEEHMSVSEVEFETVDEDDVVEEQIYAKSKRK